MIKRILAAAFFTFVVLLSVNSMAAENMIARRVSGQVVATDTGASPNTIVLKTKNWKKQTLIVGADVTEKTVIKKGNGAITLGDIKPGESVEMSYTRNGGIVATSIKVK